MAATPTECSVSRKAGFMLQILPCWSTMNIGKLMLSMFIVSPPCHGKHRVLAECSEGVRWEPTLAAATHRGHGGLLPRRGERRKSALSDEGVDEGRAKEDSKSGNQSQLNYILNLAFEITINWQCYAWYPIVVAGRYLVCRFN